MSSFSIDIDLVSVIIFNRIQKPNFLEIVPRIGILIVIVQMRERVSLVRGACERDRE